MNNFIKKFYNKQIISYLIFGVLTTFVNIVISYVLTAFCNLDGNLSSTVGIIASILFAYFTNRKWVFESVAITLKDKCTEFGKFILGRAFTMIIEILGVFLLNDVIRSFYGMFSNDFAYLINKVLISVIVIILNFLISKFFTFRKIKNS